MKKVDIVRAWRDEEYYLSLSAAERAALPANPAAPITVTDAGLEIVGGGAQPAITAGSAICSRGCYPVVNCD
jgi:mersacidin/lichenicidin family type 2 lantibiotic